MCNVVSSSSSSSSCCLFAPQPPQQQQRTSSSTISLVWARNTTQLNSNRLLPKGWVRRIVPFKYDEMGGKVVGWRSSVPGAHLRALLSCEQARVRTDASRTALNARSRSIYEHSQHTISQTISRFCKSRKAKQSHYTPDRLRERFGGCLLGIIQCVDLSRFHRISKQNGIILVMRNTRDLRRRCRCPASTERIVSMKRALRGHRGRLQQTSCQLQKGGTKAGRLS